MSVSDLVNLTLLIDDAKCFSMIRQSRWPDGVRCPRCASASAVCNGHDDRQKDRQRYLCKDCSFRFDDLTDTVLAGRHQPLKMWVLCLYFMGLNLSNRQIAKELGLNESDVQAMTSQLREGITASAPAITLEGKVEADEVYVVAGHKGHLPPSKKRPRGPAPTAQRRARTRDAFERKTTDPRVDPARRPCRDADAAQCSAGDHQTYHRHVVAKGSLTYTDEYDIYARLPAWGYGHETVCHAKGEYARDDDGDGFCEVHVNTMEGCWSLPRSWLRPHRGISQEKLPAYLGFFELVHNARQRGKTLLAALLKAGIAAKPALSPQNP